MLSDGPSRRDRGRRAIRALLEAGPSDPRVMQRRALLDELEKAMARGSAKRLKEVGQKLAAIEHDILAAEREQRAAMKDAVERAMAAPDDAARVTKLCDAFEICALTEIVAQDDFDDAETVDRAVEHKHAIVAALDAMAPGQRAAIAVLLDSPFAGVRASAGAHLLNAGLMRERVVPMLQEIEENLSGSAGWTAFWALSPDDHGAWLTKKEDAGES